MCVDCEAVAITPQRKLSTAKGALESVDMLLSRLQNLRSDEVFNELLQQTGGKSKAYGLTEPEKRHQHVFAMTIRIIR